MKWAREPLDVVVALESARLDKLLAAWWPLAIGGDKDAAGIVLRAVERRAKPLGLDVPKRIDITGTVETWVAREGLDPQEVLIVAEGIFKAVS